MPFAVKAQGLGPTLALGLFVSALGVAASAASLPPDLAAAAHAYDQAQMTSDGKALSVLLADDYTLVNGDGSTENKADFVKDYTTGGFHLDPFVVQTPVQIVWVGGAVLGGVVDYKGVVGGKRFGKLLRFADIWAKRDGRWVVVYTQVGAVGSPASPGSH